MPDDGTSLTIENYTHVSSSSSSSSSSRNEYYLGGIIALLLHDSVNRIGL